MWREEKVTRVVSCWWHKQSMHNKVRMQRKVWHGLCETEEVRCLSKLTTESIDWMLVPEPELWALCVNVWECGTWENDLQTPWDENWGRFGNYLTSTLSSCCHSTTPNWYPWVLSFIFLESHLRLVIVGDEELKWPCDMLSWSNSDHRAQLDCYHQGRLLPSSMTGQGTFRHCHWQ